MISISDNQNDTLKGYLYKWTNYMKGYQKRWFVLSSTSISYYRNPAEVSHTCRGTINLKNASIKSADSCYFVVSNSGTQTFYLKASNEIDQKKWVNALLTAKSKIQKRKGDNTSDSEMNLNEDEDLVAAITSGVEDGSKQVEMSLKQMQLLQDDLNRNFSVALGKLDEMNSVLADLEKNREPSLYQSKVNDLRERSNLFKVSMTAVVGSSKDFMNLAQTQSTNWKKIFIAKRDRQILLEQMVEELAKQLRQLENQAKYHSSNSGHASSMGGSFVRRKANSSTPKVSGGPGLAMPANASDSPAESANEVTESPSDLNSSFDLLSKSPKLIFPVECNNDDTESDESDTGDFYDARETFSVTLPSQFNTSSDSLSTENYPMMPPKIFHNKTGNLPEDEDDEISDNVSLDMESDNYLRNNGTKGREVQVIQSRQTTSIPEADYSSELVPLNENKNLNNASTPSTTECIIKKREKFNRRKRIPFRPNISLSLWSFMKNCIGKELTKIPMPVNFSEPLSMLQRLTETFEYSHLLDSAARAPDSLRAMAYIAAFAVSTYSGTAVRTNKPFNPLLGETFECDRTDDLGWRCIAEQVSHHPPVAAFHCESDLWKCWFDFSITSKFRGKYLQVIPLGLCHLYIRSTGHHYTWNKVTLTVQNIIVGKLWIDNSGDIDMINHNTNEKCKLTFHPYSYFSYDTPKKVTGAVTNVDGDAEYILNGTWDSMLECSKVISSSQKKTDKTIVKTGNAELLWEVKPYPPDSEKMYNFTEFAMTLNDQNEKNVAPTDSRLRPDQQLMEIGNWDEANVVKVKLEDLQRKRRAERKLTASANAAQDELPLNSEDVGHKMAWFRIVHDNDSKSDYCQFTDQYWTCKERNDWSKCLSIYDI